MAPQNPVLPTADQRQAERSIRNRLNGWAHTTDQPLNNERTVALARWADFHNRRRPHGALGHKPPIACFRELNNPLRSYTKVD